MSKREAITNVAEGVKETCAALLVGMLIGRAIMENIIKFLENLKIELPYDAALPLLDMCLKRRSQHLEKTSALLGSLQHYSQ